MLSPSLRIRATLTLLVFLAAAGNAWGEGVSLARIPLVRVNLERDRAELRLGARSAWRLGIVGSGLRPTAIDRGSTWTLRAEVGRIMAFDEKGRRRGAVADTLFAFSDDPQSGPLMLEGKPYRGELLLYLSSGRLCAVDVVDLESYLRAVVPVELGSLTPATFEAVKAQAVAARSYTLSSYGHAPDRGFDVFDSVEDQVYGGMAVERPVCSQAVDETRGVVAVYNGRPIRAYYCSTCGGHTASPDEVWGQAPVPYLHGVRDETDKVSRPFCRASPFYQWSEQWSGREFESMLARSLPRMKPEWSAARLGPLRAMSIRGRSSSNRVACLRLEFRHGLVELNGDEIRWALRRPGSGEALRSALLTSLECRLRRGRIDRVRIQGQGYGHGVGMCQFGAIGMAQAGYSCEQILRFYYQGAQLKRYY